MNGTQMNRYPVLTNSRGRFTPHTFVAERSVRNGVGEHVGYEQVFRCDETGHERRFGFTSQSVLY